MIPIRTWCITLAINRNKKILTMVSLIKSSKAILINTHSSSTISQQVNQTPRYSMQSHQWLFNLTKAPKMKRVLELSKIKFLINTNQSWSLKGTVSKKVKEEATSALQQHRHVTDKMAQEMKHLLCNFQQLPCQNRPRRSRDQMRNR